MSNMIIKLKIPSNGAQFVCPTCNKSFTTGKGLGGHKRVHMENKNKRNHESMELQNGEETLAPNSCPVCHQTYASEKALHGHMRKHPNRGWRGMVPPPPPPVEAEAPPPNPALPQPNHSVVGENSSLVVNDDSGKTNVKEEKELLCDICGMVFRSCKCHALGGHKSHHLSEGDRSAGIYMEQPEGFVGVADQGQLPLGEEGNDGPSSSLGFGFDLNELPPEMDD